MDPASTVSHMPPPARRPYKRVSPHQWEEQKDRIHQLFIDQDKTHEDVIRILKENYGFDIGLRQLKRKTEAWGFVKNIPSTEMEAMVHKRKRRQENVGKATKFMRRNGAGDFQEVSQERLDRFQKRSRLNTASAMSTSPVTPSNIIYDTPSYGNGTPRSTNLDRAQAARQSILEFNSSVEEIFSENTNDGLGHQPNSPLLSSRGSSVTPLNPYAIELSAVANAFDGDYMAAGQKFHLAGLIAAGMCGPRNWRAVALEFIVAVMKAAQLEGCPQSIATRIVQELSHFLMRERQEYIRANQQTTSSIELRKTLTGLKRAATWYSALLVQQRAIRIWEPILGSDHPKIERMRGNIALLGVRDEADLDEHTWLIEEEGAIVETGFDPDNHPQLRSIADLVHLEDGSPNDLLEKFCAYENSDITSRKLQEELALLRYGRSRSMLGGFYSFLGQYDNAEKAFQDGVRYMKYEDCIEIKLHRMLWYAEHKTRIQDWDGMSLLLSQAHNVFMKDESESEFIITHFPDRFKLLCMAASKRAPIDEVVCEPLNDEAFEQLQNSEQEPSSSRNFISSSDRLFPLSPRGFNSTISIEAWRQFVISPPMMGNNPQACE